MKKYIIGFLLLSVSVNAQTYQSNPDGTVSLFGQDGAFISRYQYTTNCLNGTCQQYLMPWVQERIYIAPEPRIQGSLPPTYYQPQYGPQGQNRTLEQNLSTPIVPAQPYGLNLPNSNFNVPYRPPANFGIDKDKDQDRLRNFRTR